MGHGRDLSRRLWFRLVRGTPSRPALVSLRNSQSRSPNRRYRSVRHCAPSNLHRDHPGGNRAGDHQRNGDRDYRFVAGCTRFLGKSAARRGLPPRTAWRRSLRCLPAPRADARAIRSGRRERRVDHQILRPAVTRRSMLLLMRARREDTGRPRFHEQARARSQKGRGSARPSSDIIGEQQSARFRAQGSYHCGRLIISTFAPFRSDASHSASGMGSRPSWPTSVSLFRIALMMSSSPVNLR